MLASALPFFLKADPGERYCLFHGPDPSVAPRGAVLYIHPFAEELNRSRRMAALQSRAFAAAGYGVLQIDLFGCGDSSGDFGAARLPIWRHDIALARQWLQARVTGPLHLWGLRLGALLALDHAAASPQAPDAMLLWQPVSGGAAHLQQFMRAHSTAKLFGNASEARGIHGREVAGYAVHDELAEAIAALDAGRIDVRAPVHWFEMALTSEDDDIGDAAGVASTKAPSLQLPLGSDKIIAGWRSGGATVVTHPYIGTPFWASIENNECEGLLQATARLLAPSDGQP